MIKSYIYNNIEFYKVYKAYMGIRRKYKSGNSEYFIRAIRMAEEVKGESGHMVEKDKQVRRNGLMVMNEKIRERKKRLFIVMVILLIMTTGCGNAMQRGKGNGAKTVSDTAEESMNAEGSIDIEESSDTKESGDAGHSIIPPDDIAAVCQDIYEEAVEKNTSTSPEVIHSMVKRLGEHGYSAVDSENQINMVCPEQMKRFCGQVEAQEEAEAVLIIVKSAVSFFKYEFKTKEGNVEVQRSYYLYQGGYWKTVSTENYPAYAWVYPEEGYLFFEEYHMPGYDGSSGHTAVRIEPLDERCRELNRKYLRTIGYELNNLFTSDWSEDDFRELNFYDLYEILYQMKNGQYGASEFFAEGVNYEIPKAEFESVFQNFFRIDSRRLQQDTIYHEDTGAYQYRTRGMHDFAPTPEIPYPEVISCEENQDGTIKLTVNAVWPEENLGKAFCHEVVIRPLEDGGFQYVSNHVIPSEDNVEVTWYTERLSEDKWQEYYGRLSK